MAEILSNPYLLFTLGLVGLTLGAEFLVLGASRIAATLGVSTLVIGLTVVAFGTSTPELVVSSYASMSGSPDLSIGNVIGSNIVNILLILGVCALLFPLIVHKELIWRDIPILILVSTAVWVMSFWGDFVKWEGVVLLLGLIWYTSHLVREGKGKEPIPIYTGSWPLNIFWVFAGLILLILGSQLVIESSTTIARSFGVSELIIGLTLVALGTSLPEVATSVVAVVRGERDLAVGNIVGSNIFNLLGVLGFAILLSPTPLHIPMTVVTFDFPVMVAVAIACLPIFFTGHTIYRWEGALFLGYYIAYNAYLFLRAQEHDSLPIFTKWMLFFVFPLTFLTISIGAFRYYQKRSH